MINQKTLIVGANSGIAKALAAITQASSDTGLILIGRDLSAYSDVVDATITKILVNDYQPDTIEYAISKICIDIEAPITQVFVCTGVLHNQKIQPEKRLENFDSESFQELMRINALTPMLWVKLLSILLAGKAPCKIVVFSARVGSISDNELGGWYSYRASKAALNMMLKTTAIELARRAKNIKIIAFHPGTTDTPLSKPFQKNVPKGKLLTPEFVAKRLLVIVNNTDVDGKASYLDWQGKPISW